MKRKKDIKRIVHRGAGRRRTGTFELPIKQTKRI